MSPNLSQLISVKLQIVFLMFESQDFVVSFVIMTVIKKKCATVFLSLFALLASLGFPMLSAPSAGSVVVAAPDVLAIHSMDWLTPNYTTWINQLIATGAYGSVAMFDAAVANPTAADLNGVEVVIISTNLDLLDQDAVGNLLADFVDQGGRVIVTTYAVACSLDTNGPVKWGLGGRWETDNYSPILPSDPRGGNCAEFAFDFQHQMQVLAPSSPYMANVGAIVNQGSIGSTDINTDLVFASGATPLAEWSAPANLPMAAVGANCVFAVNFFPPQVLSFLAPTATSFNQMIENFATLPCTRSDQTPEPTPEPTPDNGSATLVTATFTG